MTIMLKKTGTRKLSRAERNDVSKQRIFEAAAAVVGEFGYAGASITRITQRAGIAQGTFYNHFENRQELLEKLLPALGHGMLEFIRNQVDPLGSEEEQEQQRLAAFFAFLENNPSFLRILIEAPQFAAEGYRLHMRYVTAGYARLLRRITRRSGRNFDEKEIEVLVHILMGARDYLARAYLTENSQVPGEVVSAYMKLLTHGLFRNA